MFTFSLVYLIFYISDLQLSTFVPGICYRKTQQITKLKVFQQKIYS